VRAQTSELSGWPGPHIPLGTSSLSSHPLTFPHSPRPRAPQLMQVAAWGLVLGTAFFAFFGIKTSKDFFLMMGLIACTMGNVVFALWLWEQAGEGTGKGTGSNDTMATAYLALAALSLYGIYCQFQMYREEGCGLDDDDDEEGEQEEEDAAPPAPVPANAGAIRDAPDVKKRK
jgi:hypothetical protein